MQRRLEEKEELIQRKKEIEEVRQMSPLVWAYIGDSIYELYVRMYLVQNTKLKPHYLHIKAIQYVKAGAQAEILKNIEEHLTEEEKEIVRRGRNAENHHLPKNASSTEYRYSTALEALIGYLYLTKQDERLKEILKLCIESGKM